MTIELKVTSTRIGGNPGGKCVVIGNGTAFPAYYKFCYGSKAGGDSPFRAPNQPIYEALTFDLARKFGLQTPDTFVLLNGEGDVKFSDWRKFADGKHNPSGRRCYFVSRLIDHPVRPEADPTSNRILEAHRAYLESLLIADIINIKQNYSLVGEGKKADIRYLDLGCSFVHAKGGFLLQQNKTRINNSKSLKETMKRLSNFEVIDAVDDKILNVADFIRGIPFSSIPTLNPLGFRAVKTLLSDEELDIIMRLVAQGFSDSLKTFDSRGLLIKTA